MFYDWKELGSKSPLACQPIPACRGCFQQDTAMLRSPDSWRTSLCFTSVLCQLFTCWLWTLSYPLLLLTRGREHSVPFRAGIWDCSLSSPFWPWQDSWCKAMLELVYIDIQKGLYPVFIYIYIFNSLSGVGYKQFASIHSGWDFCCTVASRTSICFDSPVFKIRFFFFFQNNVFFIY